MPTLRSAAPSPEVAFGTRLVRLGLEQEHLREREVSRVGDRDQYSAASQLLEAPSCATV